MAKTLTPLNNDTICAVSTPAGIGGIAVIRLSGPRALEIADRLWHGKPLAQALSHTAHLGRIIDPTDNSELDQAVATVFRGPHSYTGDDTVEFSVHGSRWIQSQLLQLLCDAGARLAEAGEYTRRAFTAGHLDLTQAEAVADIIAGDSRAAHRIAVNHMRGGISSRLSKLRDRLIEIASLLELELDFSEEDVEFASRAHLRQLAEEVAAEVNRLHGSFRRGAAIKEGIAVAIAGATNAGKSSLLNALLGEDRAIVSDIHGTTRDTVEDSINLGDYRFRFIDTAGLRHTTDTIERLGIDRSHTAISKADIIIAVADPAAPLDNTVVDALRDSDATATILAINKIDIATPTQIEALRQSADNALPGIDAICISARQETGIDQLKQRLIDAATSLGGTDTDSRLLITNARHARALAAAAQSISRVIDGIDTGLSGDFIAQDLRETLHHLGTITGAITTPDILASVFTRFCIGK